MFLGGCRRRVGKRGIWWRKGFWRSRWQLVNVGRFVGLSSWLFDLGNVLANGPLVQHVGDELQNERDDGVPTADEQYYTVPTTGATLHASSAISLLNNLCSLIPRDAHTPIPHPVYEMNPNLFIYKVKLPASLPVPRDQLEFSGEIATSKKAARRSAAYQAVFELYKLGVFDDHFLPVNRSRGSVTDDIDGKPPVNVDHLQLMMEALVFDIRDDVWRDGAIGYVRWRD